MKWLRRITAIAVVTWTGAIPAVAVTEGVEADLDNPLRPNVHADLGSETAGAEAAVVSDYMTLGFGADATGKALGNQASVTFNRRGDKIRVCAPTRQTCVHR